MRPRLLRRLESAHDPRQDQYFELLTAINRWSTSQTVSPVLNWAVAAARSPGFP
ncbi:hypothetical protein ACWDQO_20680 [Streptomyces sp. NPDC003703]|uniref:hypothetical protein n=1 Tax=Streptomyces sp. NPDC003283 TaxID=3364681 RepID=UPI00367D86E3